jgi:ABC-type sugar transport system substrate-binding protein
MKIPVVDFDDNLDPETTKKAGVEVAFHIGSDNEAAGAKGANYLVSVLGKDARGPVLVIEGLSGNVTGQKRARGFVAELKRQAPGLDIVASLPGDWDSLKASDIANDTLERNPDLVAIFCANNDMALGAVEAARSKGKDKVVVIGVDGTQSALKSIRAGRLNASVAQPSSAGARTAWASPGPEVDWYSFASSSAARKAQLRAPCSLAMARAVWKASSVGAGSAGSRFNRMSPRRRCANGRLHYL